jgi:hypothetical protein
MKKLAAIGLILLGLFFGVHAMILELRGVNNSDQMLYAGICILFVFFTGI